MKRIILCADGTWNTSPGVDDDSGGTNVWKLYCAIPDTPEQLKFYDSGVGTAGNPVDHLTGGAMGQGLFAKIQDLYTFLSHVYDEGDSIYLFGFSRGAYTARSVGGMLAAFGIPNKNLSNSTTPEIFAAYRERDPAKREKLKAKLKDSYGLLPVRIAMVGVWDTVGSLGVPGKLFNFLNEDVFGFLDTTLSDCVDRAYHAISIDERRSEFPATLWTDKNGKPLPNSARTEQVWFPGVHCDVGGSYKDSQLADITLSWMMEKAKKCGVTFLPEKETKYFNLPATHAAGPAHDEWKLTWGVPKRRTVPADAVLANSVYARAAQDTQYRPKSLTFTGGKLQGYGSCGVLPYEEPVWSK